MKTYLPRLALGFWTQRILVLCLWNSLLRGSTAKPAFPLLSFLLSTNFIQKYGCLTPLSWNCRYLWMQLPPHHVVLVPGAKLQEQLSLLSHPASLTVTIFK